MAATAKGPKTSPVLRISYPQVFTPKAFQAGQIPRYGLVIMVDKKSKEQTDFMKLLYKDATEVLVEKWPNPEMRPRIPLTGHDKSLFKDGDTALNNQGIPIKEKSPEYVGHYLIRANSLQKPTLVDKSRQEIMNTDKIYAGCYCKVNVNVYAFDQPLNKGVTIGLNGVQFWADGEPLGGGKPSVDEMFEVESGADDPANYKNPFAGGAENNPFS